MGCASSSNSLSTQVNAATSNNRSKSKGELFQKPSGAEPTAQEALSSFPYVFSSNHSQPQLKDGPSTNHPILAQNYSAGNDDFSKSNNLLYSLLECGSDFQMKQQMGVVVGAGKNIRGSVKEHSQREEHLKKTNPIHAEDEQPSRNRETENKHSASKKEDELNAADKSVKSSLNKPNCNNSILNTSLEKIKHLKKRMSSKRGNLGAEQGEVSLLSIRNVMSREDNILDRTNPNIFFGLHQINSNRINEKLDEQSDPGSDDKEEKAIGLRYNTNNISLMQEQGSVSHHSKRKNDFLSISMYVHPKNEDKYSERKSIIYQDIMKSSKRKAIPNILSGLRNRSTERISERIIKKRKKAGKAAFILPLIPVSQDHSINSLDKISLPPIKPRASFGSKLLKGEGKADQNRYNFDANFSMVDNSAVYRNVIEESLSNSYGSSMLSPVAGKRRKEQSRSKAENILQFSDAEQAQGPSMKLITIKRTVKLTEPKQRSSVPRRHLPDHSPNKKEDKMKLVLTGACCMKTWNI